MKTLVLIIVYLSILNSYSYGQEMCLNATEFTLPEIILRACMNGSVKAQFDVVGSEAKNIKVSPADSLTKVYFEMFDSCNEKIPTAGLTNARVFQGDITSLNLNETFDLVIASYRIMQALESDKEVENFFETISKHLNDPGKGIINIFNPKLSPEEMRTSWCQPGEIVNQEIELE